MVPHAGKSSVEAGPGGVVVRVSAPPEDGRATEEARRALAGALSVPRSQVRLRLGRRSRTKVFEIDGVDGEEILVRLREV